MNFSVNDTGSLRYFLKSTHFYLLLGNIHDIRVPVPGTSASEFEAKETGRKKKGEDKNINWNLQVLLVMYR